MQTNSGPTDGMGKLTYRRYHIGDHNPICMSTTPNRDPKSKNNFVFQIISSIIFRVEKVDEFNGTIIFHIRAKWGDVRKHCARAAFLRLQRVAICPENYRYANL